MSLLIQGDFSSLPPKVQRFVAEKAELMNPAGEWEMKRETHEIHIINSFSQVHECIE